MTRYEDVAPISRTDADLSFSGGEVDQICDALVRVAYHDPDWRWVQSQCVRLSRHDDPDVRGLDVTCFGNIARIHGVLDLDVVTPVLRDLRSDPQMGGRVGDVWDDIEVFLANK